MDPQSIVGGSVATSLEPTDHTTYLAHPHKVTELRRKKPRLVSPGDYYTRKVPEVVDPEFNRKIGVAW